uniref:Uncharacterized protein n=1 Tax=viral metagenome TaxID=1070528 RepID=A0A6H1ZNG9_9ZZZZ
MKINTDFIHWGEIRIQFDFIEWLYRLYWKLKRLYRKPAKPIRALTIEEVDKVFIESPLVDNYFVSSSLLSYMMKETKL